MSRSFTFCLGIKNMHIASVIGWTLLVVQIYLTAVAWKVGWKWKALLPYFLGTFLGSLVIIPLILSKMIPYRHLVIALNNDLVLTQKLAENLARQIAVDPVIMTVCDLTSFCIIVVLYYMIKRKRSKIG